MKRLTNREELETALQWTSKHLPKSAIFHSWLQFQILRSKEEIFCYVDNWPDISVIARIYYDDCYGMKNYPFCFIYADFATEENTLETFLSEFFASDGASSFPGIQCEALSPECCPMIQNVLVKKFKFRQLDGGIWSDKLYYATEEAKSQVLRKTIEAPEGFEFDSLKVEESTFVNSTWPYRSDGSEKKMERRIREYPTTCIREATGQKRLASFELMSDSFATVNHLYTLPEFRRRGLARVVELKQAQKMAQLGYSLVKMVSGKNVEALKLTEGLSMWAYIGEVLWLGFRKMEQDEDR